MSQRNKYKLDEHFSNCREQLLGCFTCCLISLIKYILRPPQDMPCFTLIIASASASLLPTFPGNTTSGKPGHLLPCDIDHTGTPGRICPITCRADQGETKGKRRVAREGVGLFKLALGLDDVIGYISHL